MTFGHCRMSSGWHIIPPYVIRMSYDNVIMSSGWHTLPPLSHLDEIANVDFPQHAVALQRFRKNPPVMRLFDLWALHDVIWMTYNIAPSHPDDITLSKPLVIRMSLLLVVSHPDDFWTLQYVIQMTYECVLCHPDEITMLIPKSSGWLNYRQYLIRVTYGQCSYW